MPSLHPCLLRLGPCLFRHVSTTQHTSPPLSRNPQPVNTHLVHSPTPPHTYPILIPHLPLYMGANPGRMGDVSFPRIRQHPPNAFNVQVAYRYSKLGISESDDHFFWSSLHSGRKIGHMQPFVFGLHFILTKNWASANESNLQNHPPNAQHKFAPPPLHPHHLFPPCTPVSFD